MPNLVLICHPVGERKWALAQPSFVAPTAEFYAAQMLGNAPVEYVEWVNSGIVYRLIRDYVLSAYGIKEQYQEVQ